MDFISHQSGKVSEMMPASFFIKKSNKKKSLLTNLAVLENIGPLSFLTSLCSP